MNSTTTALPFLFTAGIAFISLPCTSTHAAEAVSVPVDAASDGAVPQNDHLQSIVPPEEDPAVAELREAIRLDPTHAAAHFALGVELYTSGNLADGIAELREALRLNPGHAEARYHLALALLKQRKAVRLTEQAAVSVAPVLAEVYVDLAKSLIASQNFPAAVMELREALRVEPTFAEAHATLGFALFNMGDVESAISEYRAVLALDPQATQARLNLATALMSKHDWSGARAELQEALRLQPNLLQALYSLGVVRYTMGDIPGAIDAYRQALRIKGDYAEAHYNLGLILKLANKDTEAVQEFHAAAVAGLPKAQYFLGAAYASGLGVDKNLVAALKFWFPAAEQGINEAREGLAQLRRAALLQTIESPEQARAVLTAFHEFREGIWREFPDLQGNAFEDSAGVALIEQGQWQNAITVLIREAYALSKSAEAQLEILYEVGIRGQWPAYDPRILSYFKATAAEGLPRPRLVLARIYAKGWGIPRDLDKAKELIKGSQDAEAQQLLKEIAAVRGEAHQSTRNIQPASSPP